MPAEAKLLLSVGELNKNKNHETVIRALAEIRDKNIHYAIAGVGGLRDYLEELSETLGIREQVHLLGYRKDILDLYRAADAFVLPSLREGLNVSLMEAMASGLPVICSKIRGNVDLIKDGEGGFLCTSAKKSDYLSAVEKLLADEQLQIFMCKRNRKTILSYDTELISKNTMRVYSKI